MIGTGKKILWNEHDDAKTFYEKLKGIMFKKSLKKPMLFFFSRKAGLENSIHSLFCFVTFDAIFLDENKKVVQTLTVKPFILNITPKPCLYLIEAPEGSVEKFKIKKGDKMWWK
jgi:uncharacterized membrane protein (UPF0127 family)